MNPVRGTGGSWPVAPYPFRARGADGFSLPSRSRPIRDLVADGTPFAIAFTDDNDTETIVGVVVSLGPSLRSDVA
jgi:hypothetical protein